MAGAKRLLGKQAWVEFAKTLAKFALVAAVLGMIAWPGMAGLDRFVGADAQTIGQSAAARVAQMIRVAALLVGALALADLVYQRRSYFVRLRMTLQELKDEFKESEGDPKIKARIRSIAMQRAQRRMMAAVPEASVILTNPTHYAVALKYDHGAMRAPIVVAKGADLIALKIREIAKEAHVPIIENPPLARALFAATEIDHPISTEHYAAVAEIISYVMRLTRERPKPT
jgi:flagellar biosynthetic protein FlhB